MLFWVANHGLSPSIIMHLVFQTNKKDVKWFGGNAIITGKCIATACNLHLSEAV